MRIFCGRAQCGAFLGTVGISVVGMNAKPVWRIEPGWMFRQGILERVDYSLRSERKIIHETFTRTENEGDQRGRVSIAREANLPIVVRCPQCHSHRMVLPDVAFRPILTQ